MPSKDANLVALTGRLEPGDWTARSFAIERIAIGGTADDHAAAMAAVEGFDTLEHRIGAGHGETLARRRLSALNSRRPSMLPVPPILMHWLAPFAAVFTKPTWDRVLVL